MAKRDTNNNDRDYVFANNENLEKQAELMQKMADDVLKRLETGYENIAARISSNYQKEYSKLEKAINKANADREKRRIKYFRSVINGFCSHVKRLIYMRYHVCF